MQREAQGKLRLGGVSFHVGFLVLGAESLEGEKDDNVPDTTALQSSDQNLAIWVFLKHLDSLIAVIETCLSCQVKEPQVFAVAHAADDAGQGAELDVNHYLF